MLAGAIRGWWLYAAPGRDPRPRLAGPVAVLRRERALPEPAPGVRRPVAAGLPRRAHHGRAAAAGLRRLPGAVADDVHAAGALLGAPRLADLRGPARRWWSPARSSACAGRRRPSPPSTWPTARSCGSRWSHGLPAVGAAVRPARRRGPGRPRRHLPGPGWLAGPGRHRRRLRRRPSARRPSACCRRGTGGRCCRSPWASACSGPAVDLLARSRWLARWKTAAERDRGEARRRASDPRRTGAEAGTAGPMT